MPVGDSSTKNVQHRSFGWSRSRSLDRTVCNILLLAGVSRRTISWQHKTAGDGKYRPCPNRWGTDLSFISMSSYTSRLHPPQVNVSLLYYQNVLTALPQRLIPNWWCPTVFRPYGVCEEGIEEPGGEEGVCWTRYMMGSPQEGKGEGRHLSVLLTSTMRGSTNYIYYSFHRSDIYMMATNRGDQPREL